MQENKQSKLRTESFDVEGLSICRVIKQAVISFLFPLGNNITRVPNLRMLVSLFIDHKFGQKICFYQYKYEKQLNQARHLKARIFSKIKRTLKRT